MKANLTLVGHGPDAPKKYDGKDDLGRPTTWDGGSIRYAEDGTPSYIIRKLIEGKPFAARLKPNENPAVEWGRFLENPAAYRDARVARKRAAPTRSTVKPPIILTPDLIEALETWLETNSLKAGRKGGCDPGYIKSRAADLAVWMCDYFKGADIRPASTDEAYAMARDALAFIKGPKHERSRRTMTDALRGLGVYLERELVWLQEENWTRKLPTIKSGSRKEKGAQAYSREYLEELYRRTDRQDYRDVMRLQVCFSMHYTELEGIVRGDGLRRLDEIKDSPPISALIEFWHKNQKWHQIYLDAAGRAAIQRLVKTKALPDERAPKQYWRRKCGYIIDRHHKVTGEDPECTDVLPLFEGTHLFRHTFNSAGKDAQEFFFQGKAGVPQRTLARISGHSPEINERYNLSDAPESLVIMPWKLEHPDDPAL